MFMIECAPTAPPWLAALPLPPMLQLLSLVIADLLFLGRNPTPPILPARNTNPFLETPRTPHTAALLAAHSTDPGRQDLPTIFTSEGSMPGLREEHAMSVTKHGLGAGALEADAKVAQKAGMPAIRVAFDQLVRFLECEEIQDQLSYLGPFCDVLV